MFLKSSSGDSDFITLRCTNPFFYPSTICIDRLKDNDFSGEKIIGPRSVVSELCYILELPGKSLKISMSMPHSILIKSGVDGSQAPMFLNNPYLVLIYSKV